MKDKIAFLEAVWPAPANIIAGTTLRQRGLSGGAYTALNLAAHVGDDVIAVRENRSLLKTSLSLSEEPCWLNQVHGTEVAINPCNKTTVTADASIATIQNKVCVVMTADCLPLLITNTSGSMVAAIHAGWRGLASGIIENTIAAMNCNVNEILVWLAPAISQSAFEVGDEVREIFQQENIKFLECFKINSRKRWQADIYQLAKINLNALGIYNIFGGKDCTYSDSEKFYSYRRDGACGRMASLIYMKS